MREIKKVVSLLGREKIRMIERREKGVSSEGKKFVGLGKPRLKKRPSGFLGR